ncbi:MAG: hypothetical protein NTX31_03575 [Burkholderiales bacterium]|nr:hypothetical protein [Burkholderiales bacterium]
MDDLANIEPRQVKVLTLPDMAFLAFLLFCMVCVAWVGRLAYQEGMHNEGTKRNGELWAKWFTQAGQDRGKAGYELASCSVSALPVATPVATQAAPVNPSPSAEPSTEPTAEAKPAVRSEPLAPTSPASPVLVPTPRTWGPCLKALTTQGGPLANMVNPFSSKPIALVAKCDMADRSLAGNLMLEKIQATPPGSAVPTINSPLTESDPIDQKMQVRITVCDKGAYPIRIAELEF